MIFFSGVILLTQVALVVLQRVCPPPPDFLYGRVNNGSRTVGSVRTYTCSPGYQSSGDRTIRCKRDRTWTTLQLACLGCPPPTLEFGCGLLSSGQNFLYTRREYVCEIGREAPQPIMTECLPGPDGPDWSTPAPNMKCRGCRSSPPFNNQGGHLVQPAPMVAYRCSTGLIAIGRGEISCIYDNGDTLWTKPVQGCAGASALTLRSNRNCAGNPCLNGGKCESEANGFKCTCVGGYSGTKCEDLKSDCSEILSSGAGKVTGVYTIQPTGFKKFKVVCDMDTDGGGWTVIQARPSVSNSNFNKLWNDYKNGFGTIDPMGSFWLGLEKLYQIVKKGTHELRLEVNRKSGGLTGSAIYKNFRISDEFSSYKLTIGRYTFDRMGIYYDAGDSFKIHNMAMFSTRDRANARDRNGMSCAEKASGGWWYIPNDCYKADINGVTAWEQYDGWNPLTTTKMMTRKTK